MNGVCTARRRTGRTQRRIEATKAAKPYVV